MFADLYPKLVKAVGRGHSVLDKIVGGAGIFAGPGVSVELLILDYIARKGLLDPTALARRQGYWEGLLAGDRGAQDTLMALLKEAQIDLQNACNAAPTPPAPSKTPPLPSKTSPRALSPRPGQ
jgi:hypothetical protein